MKEWYNGLESRERHLLIAAATFLVIMLAYVLIWEPLANKTDRLKENYQNSQQLVGWMRDAALEAKELQSKIIDSGPSSKSKNQSLLGIIDRTAKQSKLGNSVKRVQPDGKTNARVWLENVAFNEMLKWLEKLQNREGVRIVTTVIEKQEKPGVVNARLVFQRST